MANKVIGVELEEGLWKDIDFAAFEKDITPAELISRVMHAYLDAADRDALEEGIRQADAGELIEHEEVVRWFESIRAKLSEAA